MNSGYRPGPSTDGARRLFSARAFFVILCPVHYSSGSHENTPISVSGWKLLKLNDGAIPVGVVIAWHVPVEVVTVEGVIGEVTIVRNEACSLLACSQKLRLTSCA